MRPDQIDFVDQLKSLARMDDPAVVRAELEGVRPEDLAEALHRLETEEAMALLKHVDADFAADVLVELPTEAARRIAAELPDETLAHYLDILPMDDALELQEEIEPERFEALLEVIPTEDSQEIRRLMSYPEDSVGRVMTEKYFEVMPEMTMRDILADIRRASDEKYETVNDLYVLDLDRKLLGVFSLRKGIRASPDSTAGELMRTDVMSVRATDSAEEAARTMARYGFYALPVLDDEGRMAGIFTGDDAQEILREAETEDVLKLGGVSGDAEAYLSLSNLQLVKRRLPWLGILFLAQFLTGAVLKFYTGQTEGGETMLASLVLFIPLLIGAGGNAGSQVTTTITRALAVGEIRVRDAMQVLRREFTVSLGIGVILGAVGFLQAHFLWGMPNGVSIVVAIALPAIIVWSASIGSLLPIGAKRFGVDPAVMSAPFISTFVDATGLVIYFEIARRVLGLHS